MSRLLQVLERIALELEIANHHKHLEQQMPWIRERAAKLGISIGAVITESEPFVELREAMKRRQ